MRTYAKLFQCMLTAQVVIGVMVILGHPVFVCSDTYPTAFAHPPSLVPVFVHLALSQMLGLLISPCLNGWYV